MNTASNTRKERRGQQAEVLHARRRTGWDGTTALSMTCMSNRDAAVNVASWSFLSAFIKRCCFRPRRNHLEVDELAAQPRAPLPSSVDGTSQEALLVQRNLVLGLRHSASCAPRRSVLLHHVSSEWVLIIWMLGGRTFFLLEVPRAALQLQLLVPQTLDHGIVHDIRHRTRSSACQGLHGSDYADLASCRSLGCGPRSPIWPCSFWAMTFSFAS